MLPDGSSAWGVPASAQGPASGQGRSTFLIAFGVNEPTLTVWYILEYYPEERGRSISSVESHRLSCQNLAILQLLSVVTVWVGLILSHNLSSSTTDPTSPLLSPSPRRGCAALQRYLTAGRGAQASSLTHPHHFYVVKIKKMKETPCSTCGGGKRSWKLW